MAKKKSKQQSGPGKGEEPGAEASQESLDDVIASEAEDSPSEAQATTELQEARAEIARLREELAGKDAELQSLRRQLEARDSAPKFDQSKLQDVAKLQDRLAALRKDQSEADAARDTAWRQLKSVVADISKLASPDYLSSINIPSQS